MSAIIIDKSSDQCTEAEECLTEAGNVSFPVSGCIDGSTEEFQDRRHPRIAACTGIWEGHIENATNLCAEGWKVCGWDTEKLLKTITWKEATAIGGCYAVNAAQDDGHCRPCINDIIQVPSCGVVNFKTWYFKPRRLLGKRTYIWGGGGKFDAFFILCVCFGYFSGDLEF